ncbi:hypothetical protein ACEYYB_12200 [Paracoccus sp. p4-l81]|uniref:hypothetical protein n=1 Tax=Paracoccus sp. p4-l81 TaxID=3342806 RepID=UPI0035B775C9
MRWLMAMVIWAGLAVAAIARDVAVRSGEHADFSRLVIAGAKADWVWQAGDGGGTLTITDGDGFDLQRAFDLIPRDRVTDLTADGSVLTVTAAPGTTVRAARQGDLFIIDISGTPTAPSAAPPPQVALPAVPPKELGQIDGPAGLGQPAATAPSAQAQSIEQALLFRIAKAAGDGSLTVADQATLDALRRAGLLPGAPTPAAPQPEAAVEAGGPSPITCEQALAALTFDPAAPDTIRAYEQAYLAMDRARNDQGLIDLARGYLSLALPGEALAILSLRSDPDDGTARVLTAAAAALDSRADDGVDLPGLAQCGAQVELWQMLRAETGPGHADAYAIYQAMLTLPPRLRARVTERLLPVLRRNPDSASTSLAQLMDSLAPACAPDSPCPGDPGAADLGQTVRGLSQLPAPSLTDRAEAVFQRLLTDPAPIAIETAHNLDAMAFERAAEPGGRWMRAAALLAYARAGDPATALAGLTGMTTPGGGKATDPIMSRAADAVVQTFASQASDGEFLRLAFAHAALLDTCCTASTRDQVQARLGQHGFGSNPATITTPATDHSPVPGAEAVHAQPPREVEAATALQSATSAPHSPPATQADQPPPVAPAGPDAAKPSPTPTLPPADVANETTLVARSRKLTSDSAALRASVLAELDATEHPAADPAAAQDAPSPSDAPPTATTATQP